MSVREKLINRIAKRIEESTGLTREFIDTHTLWELEEILGIPHYSMKPAYGYITLKCGCIVRYPIYNVRGDW